MAQQMEYFVEDVADTTPETYDIVQVPADYTLEVLYNKWESGEITVSRFQREYVWTATQASRLIESFMMGLPVPPVYVFVGFDKKMQVIDGIQRLMSVFSFFKGSFDHGDEFRIGGINENNPLYGKALSEMAETDQMQFRQSILRCILIHQMGREGDDTSVYHVFERLNTGRMPLRNQEVRNCVYEGRLNDMIVELNDDIHWREILGRQEPDKRKRDVEIILRYLALLHDGARYRKPMKDFLSRYMGNNRNPDDEFMREERETFRESCRMLAECGKRPLNPGGPVRAAVFDAVLVALGRNRGTRPDDIGGRVKRLLEDADFEGHTSKATTDPSAVRRRLEIAESALFG